MNIILIGFMGSGKTTIGIRLSYHMKQPFLDSDKEIERRSRRTISDIFTEDGEQAFREMENAYIRSLLDGGLKNHIVSTGGGMAINKDNWLPLKKLGVVVWLRIRPETVLERLANDRSRPLLACDDRETRVKELIEYREPFYKGCSDVIVDVDNKPVERIMDEIFTKSAGVWKRKKRG
ncbi:MAG: shikimate kinase [Lachnospiraceae bacterium]|nr:shikimate kinase [Lachnospiraceae bacterium]